MDVVITSLRRTVWFVLLGAGGVAVWMWLRDRNAPPMPPTPPEWPPLTTVPDKTATSSKPASSNGSANTASVVNALVDAPDARSNSHSGTWVAPLADGTCPDTHPIKANDNSGIFHVPGGRFYDRTHAERCYVTAEAAIADGYRQAKA